MCPAPVVQHSYRWQRTPLSLVPYHWASNKRARSSHAVSQPAKPLVSLGVQFAGARLLKLKAMIELMPLALIPPRTYWLRCHAALSEETSRCPSVQPLSPCQTGGKGRIMPDPGCILRTLRRQPDWSLGVLRLPAMPVAKGQAFGDPGSIPVRSLFTSSHALLLQR